MGADFGMLPCPFCGGEARLYDCEKTMFTKPMMYALCPDCGGAMITTDKDHCINDVIAAWNRRIAPPVETTLMKQLRYIDSFVKECEGDFDNELTRQQLSSLWTALCLQHHLDPDTAKYDSLLWDIWCKVSEDQTKTAAWGGFTGFDRYMGRLLC